MHIMVRFNFGENLSLICKIAVILFVLECPSNIPLINLQKIDDVDYLPEDDRKLWKQSEYENDCLLKSGLIYSDSCLGNYLTEIGMKLVPEDLKNSIIPFNFLVILDPELNAFAMPDGTIYVHLGLLSRLENESQLAQVLGHELTHVIMRHSAHRYSQMKNTLAFTQLLSVASAVSFSQMNTGFAGFWNCLAQSGLYLSAMASMSGYSREAEEYADLKALEFMLINKYDITEAPRVFEILLEEYDDPSAATTFFYADHPKLKSRIEYVNAKVNTMIEQGLVKDEDSLIKNEEEYRMRITTLRQRMIELWILNGKHKNALEESEKLIKDFPENPELRYWTGEAYRMISNNTDTLDLASKKYYEALNIDSTFAKAYLGLALLNESKPDTTATIENYKKYLHHAPDASDKRFILNKIKQFSKK
jgi:predicted Zn-dependent protease